MIASACAAANEPKKFMVDSADGVPISYDVRGNGNDTLLFVHCWACDRTFWKDQADVFAGKGFRVVTLDLPGHGESGRNRKNWTVEGLAADVQAVADKLKLKRMVLVGHSMGSPVSLAAAARMKGRVVGVIAADSLQNAEQGIPAAMVQQISGELEKNYAAMMEGFVQSMFPKNVDPALPQFVVRKGISADHAATIALMRDFPNLDMPKLFRGAGVPIRAINARTEEGMKTAVEINRKYADFDVAYMDGAGHYVQLERPAEFNEKMESWLKGLLGAAPRK
jgi:pimeloyl-ACP methyl ester carboxylesterase